VLDREVGMIYTSNENKAVAQSASRVVPRRGGTRKVSSVTSMIESKGVNGRR
jgi:hypothetical protein